MKTNQAKSKWSMPGWMEPYRDFFNNTGGNSIEDLANGNSSPAINSILFTLETCVRSQIQLLCTLHKEGRLE